MRMRNLLIGGLVLVNLFGFGAISNVFAATSYVTMTSGNTFSPKSIIINVGDTVTWQNPAGGVTHSVIADDGSFTSPNVSGGQTFSLVFSTVATIPYHCGFHGGPNGVGMSGIIFVGNRTQHAANEHVLQFNAWDFDPLSSSDTSSGDANYFRTSIYPLLAGVHLPTGSEITGLEVVACHSQPGSGADIYAELRWCADPTAQCVLKATATTFGTQFGCGFYSAAPFIEVVDNLGGSYILQIDPGMGASFRVVRIFYRSSISYPPANATFTDVPTTHPFYRYIEALAASGITAGCAASPPQYCPDAPLTRGQMAVFLARGLGLFWPN